MSYKDDKVTLSGGPIDPDVKGAPQPIDPATGMHKDYWVLSEAERAKGFVRPVRLSYQHVGIPGPVHPLLDLTDEQKVRYEKYGYVKLEKYPDDEAVSGRYWTQQRLDSIGKGCGVVTRMNQTIAETYAREPGFYGSTFCIGCGTHLPVGENGEFVWDKSTERVGT